VHVIRSVSGAGKTLLAKKVALHYEAQNKTVFMALSTHILSNNGTTVHSGFKIPAQGQLPTLTPSQPAFQRIVNTDVIFEDEYSMLTCTVFNMLLYRVEYACKAVDKDIAKILIVFFGDLAQLPPVCQCNKDDDGMCKACHITASILWSRIPKYQLNASLRHATDPDSVSALTMARNAPFPQHVIDEIF
jgi:hypothetical protein